MGTDFDLGKMIKFWRWMLVLVTQQCECTYCHWTVHLQIVKMVNFMLKSKRTREKTVADERLKCFESWRAVTQKATDLAKLN